ncbi:MAG: SDR family NAD(P)-dependent oxidoreductase [Pseudomonadales bacterium]|nr:SDR family NAD(P)-dependent oxidoreductase [Pseudomonadales bacterium]
MMPNTREVYVITGAASGMGKLAAETAAKNGKLVAAIDLNETALHALESQFDSVHTFKIDITEYKSVEKTINQIVSSLGPIARVTNCAGIMPLGTLSSQDPELIEKIMSVNYLGTVNINKAVLGHLQQQGSGQIVNFASIAGWSPTLAFGAYNAAKFAVVAFTEVLYQENQHHGLQICCVCPPPVNTPLFRNAINRPKVLDIAPAVEPEFILSAVEKSLSKGEWLCLPGWITKAAYVARRLAPGLVWRLTHLLEGKTLDHLSQRPRVVSQVSKTLKKAS